MIGKSFKNLLTNLKELCEKFHDIMIHKVDHSVILSFLGWAIGCCSLYHKYGEPCD